MIQVDVASVGDIFWEFSRQACDVERDMSGTKDRDTAGWLHIFNRVIGKKYDDDSSSHVIIVML
jgi:hypothetical protein